MPIAGRVPGLPDQRTAWNAIDGAIQRAARAARNLSQKLSQKNVELQMNRADPKLYDMFAKALPSAHARAQHISRLLKSERQAERVKSRVLAVHGAVARRSWQWVDVFDRSARKTSYTLLLFAMVAGALAWVAYVFLRYAQIPGYGLYVFGVPTQKVFDLASAESVMLGVTAVALLAFWLRYAAKKRLARDIAERDERFLDLVRSEIDQALKP